MKEMVIFENKNYNLYEKARKNSLTDYEHIFFKEVSCRLTLS